ncbi:MAG: protein kinase [Labilithrix sp.]|nr:protein kinase [Labilithrix sp.]MBX3222879.1 protein kinase [Labilithrix sp.]
MSDEPDPAADPTMVGDTVVLGRSSDGGRDSSGARLVAGRYAVEGLLGAGGMGTVYLAHDLELDERIALKVLQGDAADPRLSLELFRREVKLARRVTHPNIARVFDIGATADGTFLTMELVDGVSLGSIAGEPLDAGQAAEIGLALCDGLTAAHDAGILHCDLKPANVIAARDGRHVITDFGVARALRASSSPSSVRPLDAPIIAGTPAYMSPEQMEGKPLDERTDLYALGALLYRLVAGALPWKSDSFAKLLAARSASPPPDPRDALPSIPSVMAELVMKCLAPARSDRFASAREVASALRGALTTRARAAVLAAPERSPIAVLPIDATDAELDAYLAAGIGDEIAEHLSASEELAVKPRALVRRLASDANGSPALARALRVAHAVSGHLSREGDRLNLELKLISVPSWRPTLTASFDFEAAGVLTVARRAARLVALALEREPAHAPESPDAPADAAAAFLRGRYLYRSGDEAATDAFARAHALAPEDARIAGAYALALVRSESLGATSLVHARAVADRTVELAPNLAEGRLALALVNLYEGEGRAAAVELRQAYRLDPTSADVLGWMGRLLVEVGAIREGLEKIERALARDPTLGLAAEARPRALALLGDFTAAVAAFDDTRTLVDDRRAFALGRLHAWRPTEAVEAELVVASRDATRSASARAILGAFIQAGRGQPLSDEIAEQCLAALPGGGAPRRAAFRMQLRAELFAATGRRALATAALEHLDEQSFVDLAWIDGCPALLPLQGSAELERLRRATAARAMRIREALTR